jgi:hypothetical protein
MITTGIHIPQSTKAKLAKAVAAVHRRAATMTISEFRGSYRRQHDKAAIGCFFRIETTKTGAIKAFRANMINRPIEKSRDDGFEADVLLVGRADYAASAVALECGEFLMRRELHRRAARGERELVHLTQDELDTAREELRPLQSVFFSSSARCGRLSERFRLALIEEEIATRTRESTHQRLQAAERNEAFLVKCRKALDIEADKALAWRERHEQWGRRLHSSYDLRERSETDRTIIAFRDHVGWNP